MELLPKWELTGTLPAFSDDDSSTVIEMTYKLYNTMQTLISEYNSFADSVNSKILAFESKYNSDFESFTTSIRQEIQEFTNTFNSNIANLNSRLSEVDSKYQTSITNLQNQINTINNILASDDVNLDTLQELVNALKNNVSSINDLFTELAKKVNITDYNLKINSIESGINNISSRLTDAESNISNLSENTYRKNEIDTKVSTINSNINTLSNNTYKKSEIDTKVSAIDTQVKAIDTKVKNLSTITYTKNEVNNLVNNTRSLSFFDLNSFTEKTITNHDQLDNIQLNTNILIHWGEPNVQATTLNCAANCVAVEMDQAPSNLTINFLAASELIGYATFIDRTPFNLLRNNIIDSVSIGHIIFAGSLSTLPDVVSGYFLVFTYIPETSTVIIDYAFCGEI